MATNTDVAALYGALREHIIADVRALLASALTVDEDGYVVPAPAADSAPSANGVALWMGSTYANRESAPFRVTMGGDVTAAGNVQAAGGGVTGDFYIGSNSHAGKLKIGANQNVWFDDTGARLVLPDTSGALAANSAYSVRWHSSLGSTWDNTKNAGEALSYRDTTNKRIDSILSSFVGSTDAGTYTARTVLRAQRNDGSSASGAELSVEHTPTARVLRFTGDFAAFASGVRLLELSTTPTAPGAGEAANLYMKADKIVIQYNDAGTVKYRYMDLAGTSATWTYTTTAP